MTLDKLYRSYKADGDIDNRSHTLLTQMHWYTTSVDFDPKTGEALPQGLSTFLSRITQPQTAGALQDRLWRITEHARNSIERVFKALYESPRREQALLPVRSVRELDANSFIKLSNRPGRNIREKLAHRPYLYAVRRYQSVDLPENRLLKEYVTRLAKLLEQRCEYLGEEEDELLPKIQSWLLSDEARKIARWDNLPPNNALLSHREYRRIWNSWSWLQTLDDAINKDFNNFELREKTMNEWIGYGKKYSEGKYIFADMPVLFNYDKFEINPWGKIFSKEEKNYKRSSTKNENFDIICIDFTQLRPHYSTDENNNKVLSETYLWQQWENEEISKESVKINLFNSDALFLHPDAVTISIHDLLFSKDKKEEQLNLAAHLFAKKIHDTFNNNTLIWLIPDFLNDFELVITRQNLNARFQNAEPLPRSVAAIFEHIKYSDIRKENYSVAVIDTIGGKICVTKLIARFDPELKKRVPEICGFYWERCPPVVIAANDFEETNYEFITVDETGRWYSKTQPDVPQYPDINILKNDKRLGQFAYHINLIDSPVTGGMRLYALQQKAGDIPLWRYHIPELSIKVMKDGRLQPHWLVSRNNTPIVPIRGRPVPIPIFENFTLPAGKKFYQFPLFQGENDDDLGYSARLESPEFPLNTDTVCRLNLSFTYGADDPYSLFFEPLKNEFSSVCAKWKKVVEKTDAPVPPYPEPLMWDDLRHWKNAQGIEENILDWLIDSLNKLNDRIPNRSLITISRWLSKRNEYDEIYWYAFAETENGDCYCHQRNFIDSFQGTPNMAFSVGTKLFGNIQKKENGNLSAYDISARENIFSKDTISRLRQFKEKSMQNRMPVIWADNRSLDDADTPIEFKQEYYKLISLLFKRLPRELFKWKFFPLLSCLHKDTTKECIQWIKDQVDNENITDVRAVGFALGDVSQPWQENIFKKLLLLQTPEDLRVFAYAIWREQHFIEKFKVEEIEAILDKLIIMLSEIKPCPQKRDDKDKWTVRNWVRATAEPLELLLGLLRTRDSSDHDIKMILQPHQKKTKELSKLINNITDIIKQSDARLFSRVKPAIKTPEGEKTLDLLPALSLFLAGDDTANAISIAVSDDEKEND